METNLWTFKISRSSSMSLNFEFINTWRKKDFNGGATNEPDITKINFFIHITDSNYICYESTSNSNNKKFPFYKFTLRIDLILQEN